MANAFLLAVVMSSSTAGCSEQRRTNLQTKRTSYIDSDLQDLYDSFDYQDKAARHATAVAALGSKSFDFVNVPLYSKARLPV